MMKVYIAGPMSGYPAFNYPRFFEVAQQLRERGFDPINPAALDDPETLSQVMASPDGKIDGQLNGQTYGDFLSRAVKTLVEHADAVCVLEGWLQSRGAKTEVAVAHVWHKPVYEVSELLTGEAEVDF